jgi:hypothetical protein
VFFGLDSVLDFRLAEGIYADENNAPLTRRTQRLQGTANGLQSLRGTAPEGLEPRRNWPVPSDLHR